MDHHPPVTQFVPEPLNDHGPVVRQCAGGNPLLTGVADQVGLGVVIEMEPVEAGRVAADLAVEPTDPASQFGRASFVIAVPKRQPSGTAGGRRDAHLVSSDLLDPPSGRPQGEDVTNPRFVDHLLVQLAHPAPTLLVGDQEDTEHAAVGDGAS